MATMCVAVVCCSGARVSGAAPHGPDAHGVGRALLASSDGAAEVLPYVEGAGAARAAAALLVPTRDAAHLLYAAGQSRLVVMTCGLP